MVANYTIVRYSMETVKLPSVINAKYMDIQRNTAGRSYDVDSALQQAINRVIAQRRTTRRLIAVRYAKGFQNIQPGPETVLYGRPRLRRQGRRT